ncbi:hypothetical protein SLA2020_496250 [Shorea laevis]
MDVDFITSGELEDDSVQLDHQNNGLANLVGERCGICMDVIIDRGVLDCCQHWFCFACIDNWATITNLCPLCQSEFQLITCVPVYDTIGSNKVDEDSISRDEDWSVEGKSNTLSFPSYYIDENAVICLDGDGCKIRCQSLTVVGDSSIDTSIACDSCDIWYHAFCVGFDTESTTDDTWLCPRCIANQCQQKSDVISIKKTNDECNPGNANNECLMEAAFSGKFSVSLVDAGETAIVVSMVGGNQHTGEPRETFSSTSEVCNALKIETSNSDAGCPSSEIPFSEKKNVQPILEGDKLESLSHDKFSTLPSKSLVLDESKTCKVGEAINDPSSLDDIRNSSQKASIESYATNQESESGPSVGLHLGLSVSSDLSVVDMNGGKSGTVDQVNTDLQHQNQAEGFMASREKIVPDDNAGKIIGVKRKHTRDDIFISSDEDTNDNNESEDNKKKRRAEELVQLAPHGQTNASISDDNSKCSTLKAVSGDVKVKIPPEKEDMASDIMSIVQGTSCRASLKGHAQPCHAEESSKDGENVSGLRVKKIMRTASEDKESSIVVQKLRKEIREAVCNKSSKDFGEHLFDPQLLAAFRAAIAGPKPESVKKLSPSSVKMKKSILQKGKVRENLTKKIYGDSNGRRRRAWDRDCEVEFWKYRCTRASKPEKIETLQSVLNLLRKNPESSENEPKSEWQASNPILSRLYLADTSVFPRKDDIKPLSALNAAATPEQNEQLGSMDKTLKPSLPSNSIKVAEMNNVLSDSQVGAPSTGLKGIKASVSNAEGGAASGKTYPVRGSEGSSDPKSSNSKVAAQKVDKRKWALEVLARKKAAESRNGAHEKQEDNAALKGNYPLLAQLPVDMRPTLAPSRHNKIPISVRQTQLYRLTELFLRKANLPVIRRTAETELAVADAINIEKEVADRSNSKVVYLNLCSREISHRSDDKFVRARESNTSSPSEPPIDRQEQGSSECSTDPSVEEALRAAGLLSDSPPNSPHCKREVPNEVDDSSIKVGEEEPNNIFEMDSHMEMDIYGDFEYDLEDEDYIGMNAEKIQKLQPEESVSKMKVVFSTIATERSNNVVGLEDHGRLGKVELPTDSSYMQKNNTDAAIGPLTVEDGTNKTSVPLETLPDEENEELSLAECEELYGPDKEPLINKIPEESQKPCGIVDTKASAVNEVTENAALNQGVNASKSDADMKAGNLLANVGQSSSSCEHSADINRTGENIQKKGTSSREINKQCDVNPVSKKVETYIKEHIRPLCKSGVITVEQYRWAVAKTTDKVMKYHINAKNANFLVKEGEKVKKLAEQYVEAAQQGQK